MASASQQLDHSEVCLKFSMNILCEILLKSVKWCDIILADVTECNVCD